MQQPYRPRAQAPEDLTARARIRDAALRLFAERGVDGTTIRAVAEAAGVSPALVQHHFGSKEGLRAACDAYAVQVIREVEEGAFVEGRALSQPGFLAQAYQAATPAVRYLARALVEGSPAAAALFDELVALTREYAARDDLPMFTLRSDDPDACAAVLTAMELGLLVLHEHLSRALGADLFSPAGFLRFQRASIDIYANGILDPAFAAQARAAFDAYQAALSAATPPTPRTKDRDDD